VPAPLRSLLRGFFVKTGIGDYEVDGYISEIINLSGKEKQMGLSVPLRRAFKKYSRDEIQRKFVMTYYDKSADCFDFGGVKIPCDLDSPDFLELYFAMTIVGTLGVKLFLNDDYSKENIALWNKCVRHFSEEPYGYVDGDFDVTVRQGDVVIDAGAHIGDFSAYCAYKGAVCYAFEPMKPIFATLKKTAQLNGSGLIPVLLGLSSKKGKAEISIMDDNVGGNSIVIDRKGATETIDITTVDDFVRDNNLSRVDFIKADIEGSERDMLKGARETLKKFAPKLALCTYHLSDDTEVMTALIKEANPAYKVVQRREKLYAAASA
jgi:FkbM family methyltransferase